MKTVFSIVLGFVIGQIIFGLMLRWDENRRKRKEDELEHLKRVLIKDKIRKNILDEKKWSVTDYLSRMEKAWDKIQKEKPEPYKLTLWCGQNGLRLNDDGTTEWIKKDEPETSSELTSTIIALHKAIRSRAEIEATPLEDATYTANPEVEPEKLRQKLQAMQLTMAQQKMAREIIDNLKPFKIVTDEFMAEQYNRLYGNAELEELERRLRLGAYKTNCKNAYCCPIKICRTGEVVDAIIEPHEIDGPTCGRNMKGEIVRDYIGVKHKVITIKPIPLETQAVIDEETFTYITIMDGTNKTIEMYLGNSHTLIEK